MFTNAFPQDSSFGFGLFGFAGVNTDNAFSTNAFGFGADTNATTNTGAADAGGASSSRSPVPVLQGDQYANDPAYRFEPSAGGYVKVADLDHFIGQTDAWSGYFSKTYHSVPSIGSYVAAAAPGTSTYDIYMSYHDQVTAPFTQFQIDFNKDPARVAAAWEAYDAQVAAQTAAAEADAKFSVAKYDAGVRQQDAADWQATKDWSRGMFEGTVNAVAQTIEFVASAPVLQPYYAYQSLVQGKVVQPHFPVPYSASPTSASQAAGRFMGPIVLGAIPVADVVELVNLARAPEVVSGFEAVSNAATQTAIRERVLANIANSQAGNAASRFDQFIANEGKVQEAFSVWPPNRGRIGPVSTVELQPGLLIDRYGSTRGSFLSPLGTPFADRALPSYYQSSVPYFQYEVVQPIPNVIQSRALPWFAQHGMGPQFELPKSVQWYLDNGYLR